MPMMEANTEHTQDTTAAKAAHLILTVIREVLVFMTAITVGKAFGAFAGILTLIGLLLILCMIIIKSTGKDVISLAACGNSSEELKKAERKSADVVAFIMLLVYIGTRFLCS